MKKLDEYEKEVKMELLLRKNIDCFRDYLTIMSIKELRYALKFIQHRFNLFSSDREIRKIIKEKRDEATLNRIVSSLKEKLELVKEEISKREKNSQIEIFRTFERFKD